MTNSISAAKLITLLIICIAAVAFAVAGAAPSQCTASSTQRSPQQTRTRTRTRSTCDLAVGPRGVPGQAATRDAVRPASEVPLFRMPGAVRTTAVDDGRATMDQDDWTVRN